MAAGRAGAMVRERCTIRSNERVAPGHHVIRFESKRIAARAKPGQFVQVSTTDGRDPLLPRPFSFLGASGGAFDVLYQVVGQGTRLLAETPPGRALWVLGPLGNGFSIGREERLLLVGGGVGIPPLLHLAGTLVRRAPSRRGSVTVMLGARTRSLLLCEASFRRLGVRLELATDDGSKGSRGFVTALLDEALTGADPARTRVYTCGPTPMLRAVSSLACKHEVPCEVSVEVPMACGFGACLGCAIRVRKDNPEEGSRYAMACTEGPVFGAEEILWP